MLIKQLKNGVGNGFRIPRSRLVAPRDSNMCGEFSSHEIPNDHASAQRNSCGFINSRCIIKFTTWQITRDKSRANVAVTFCGVKIHLCRPCAGTNRPEGQLSSSLDLCDTKVWQIYCVPFFPLFSFFLIKKM